MEKKKRFKCLFSVFLAFLLVTAAISRCNNRLRYR